MRTQRCVITVLILILTTMTNVSAQDDALREFALATVRRTLYAHHDDSLELVLRKVPDAVNARVVVPTSVRVLGTAVHPRGAVILGTTSEPTQTFASAYVSALEAKGWMTPERMRRGGLRSPRDLEHLTFCQGEEQLSVNILPREAGPADVTIRVENPEGRSICDLPDRIEEMRLQQARDPFGELPALDPPDAAKHPMRSSCEAGMMGGSFGTGTQLDVPPEMSAADLLRHYGKQMEAAGWRVADAETLAAGTWVSKERDRPRQLTLTIRTVPGNSRCRLVSILVNGTREGF